MRRFLLMLCFLGGVIGVLSASGCGGDSQPSTANTTPTPKQVEKEGRSGGFPGKGK